MRQLISIFLISLFVAFIATPTFVAITETTIDISTLHTSSEEEKTQNERFFEEIENKKPNYFIFDLAMLYSGKKHDSEAPHSLWNDIFFDIQIPPPDLS